MQLETQLREKRGRGVLPLKVLRQRRHVKSRMEGEKRITGYRESLVLAPQLWYTTVKFVMKFVGSFFVCFLECGILNEKF